MYLRGIAIPISMPDLVIMREFRGHEAALLLGMRSVQQAFEEGGMA